MPEPEKPRRPDFTAFMRRVAIPPPCDVHGAGTCCEETDEQGAFRSYLKHAWAEALTPRYVECDTGQEGRP